MSNILTSIRGSRLGIDADGYLTSPVGVRVPVVSVGVSGSEINPNAVTTGTTAAGTIPAAGIVMITTGTTAFTIPSPVTGTRIELFNTSSSTAAVMIGTVASGGSIWSTALSSGTTIQLAGLGAGATLTAISTLKYLVTNNLGALPA